jgi:hypothetical protein
MDERKWINMDVMYMDDYEWAKKYTDERMTRDTDQLIDALKRSRKAFTHSDIKWLLGR